MVAKFLRKSIVDLFNVNIRLFKLENMRIEKMGKDMHM